MTDTSPPPPPTIRLSNLVIQTPAELRYPGGGHSLTLQEFNKLLLWARDNNVTDVDLFADDPVWIQRYGRRYPATVRPLSTAELRVLGDQIYRGAAMGLMAEGMGINTAHQIEVSREKKVRFRINMSPVMINGEDTFNMTCRVLPEVPPLWSDLGVEPAIAENWRQQNGLTLIGGPTGSGKSTLAAAGIHEDLRDPDSHRKWVSLERPIEFVYDKVIRVSSQMLQSEIPRHFKSFASGVSEGMRRGPNGILVGECKEMETMDATLEACNTGHHCVSTIHTNSVPDATRRVINFFPEKEKNGRALDVASALRMIVTQMLLPTRDGKRRACREILVFDDRLRDKLADTDPAHWARTVRRLVEAHGQPMIEPISRLWQEGLLEERDWRRLERQSAVRREEDEAA